LLVAKVEVFMIWLFAVLMQATLNLKDLIGKIALIS